jgi:hypothetical protein
MQGVKITVRNSASRLLAEAQDRRKGQILQGEPVGKGEESEEKDFRGIFLRGFCKEELKKAELSLCPLGRAWKKAVTIRSGKGRPIPLGGAREQGRP